MNWIELVPKPWRQAAMAAALGAAFAFEWSSIHAATEEARLAATGAAAKAEAAKRQLEALRGDFSEVKQVNAVNSSQLQTAKEEIERAANKLDRLDEKLDQLLFIERRRQ